MSDVPPELISDVFTRLPVKSLLRFRCVCKSWKALIDSPDFIQAHLKRQQLVKPNSDFNLILKGDTLLYSLDFSSVCSGSNSKPRQLEHPLHCPARILGSCNGLFLIAESSVDMALWNPSTKTFRKLPACCYEPLEGHGLAQSVVGFGYDGSTDDYKVVGIGQWFDTSGGTLVSRTRIYNLKLNMWKEVDQVSPYWLEGKSTLAGGALHWFPSRDPQRQVHILDQPLTLMGFNLGSEQFLEVPCPEKINAMSQLNLAVLGECLCLVSGHVCVYLNGKGPLFDRFDIWVMKEYGVKESWIKLFSVVPLGFSHVKAVKPIAYSLTGREVLLEMDRGKLMWYSLEKKSLKPFKISCGLESFETNVCLGALVPLYGNGNNRKRNVEPDEETRAKNSDKGDDFLSKGFKLRL